MDEYAWTSIDFMNFDVEGAEFDVIRGGGLFFLSPLVMFEMEHPKSGVGSIAEKQSSVESFCGHGLSNITILAWTEHSDAIGSADEFRSKLESLFQRSQPFCVQARLHATARVYVGREAQEMINGTSSRRLSWLSLYHVTRNRVWNNAFVSCKTATATFIICVKGNPKPPLASRESGAREIRLCTNWRAECGRLGSPST